MKEPLQESSWYDLPQYYELAFRDETAREVRFFERAFRRYAIGPVRRLLEPGCGSGRLVFALARRGYRVWAFDNNRHALAYATKRLKRHGLKAHFFAADLADFSVPAAVDAAYCTMNTFRHLLSEAEARAHLKCVARAVRPGGVYILGFHLLPPDADEQCIERWTARRGRLHVSYTLRVIETNRAQRIESLRISLLVRTPRRCRRFRDEFRLRIYTADDVRRLLRASAAWELCDVFDFWYEWDKPLDLNDELSDAVFVLRRTDRAA
ncbi:MAG: SAM-dependent methyltransferase [Pirellulaceae bacterium]|nr:MAG: SAM-dependent methyltransferase [Pirellulaceae bacterium]